MRERKLSNEIFDARPSEVCTDDLARWHRRTAKLERDLKETKAKLNAHRLMQGAGPNTRTVAIIPILSHDDLLQMAGRQKR